MAEKTEISWTDSTFNPVIGCTKVGPGCDHCYAERDFALRRKVVIWGDEGERHVTKTWNDPVKWQRDAAAFYAKYGRKRRVFCASLADVFDKRWPEGVRDRLWNLIRETPDLEWLIVTKRIINAARMLPEDWGDGYDNVVLIATVVNQEEADRDVPRLLNTPARRRGLSIEPMLGPIDLTETIPDALIGSHITEQVGVDWVVCGGESGPHARPMHPDWARSLRDQCAAAGVPFHFKQWGEYAPPEVLEEDSKPALRCMRGDRAYVFDDNQQMGRVGKKAAGRKLDGIEHNGFPRVIA
jgi:protein gp37